MSEQNKIIAAIYTCDEETKNPELTARLCHFSGKEFIVKKDDIVYSFNDKPISPDIAKSRGFEINKDFELPDSVNSREKLGVWLIKTFDVRNNDQHFRDLYRKHGEGLPVK